MIASIPSPSSNGFHVGFFEVHVYGLMYVVGLAAAILITVRRWESQGGSRALVYDVAMWGFPAGIIGGRLYFDLTSWGEMPPHWWGPFAIWEGGMGSWGGIALGTAVGIWRLRRAGVSAAAFLDAAAPALLVATTFVRIGNYFNQELFGGPTSLPWALQISPAHRPAGYESFATFHPTFLYELIWNLALAAFLVWLGHHRRIRPPGLFALYVAGYSAFRIFEESLRVDPSHHFLGLRLNFYVATLLCIAGLLWFAYSQGWRPTWRQSRRGAALMLAGGILALSGCGGAERAHAGGLPSFGTTSPHGAIGAVRTSRIGTEVATRARLDLKTDRSSR
jgi:prolipoprotein diacylglyceryl transferase